ncbi:hypothetical protein VHEMI04370 [[Torrubiella] hemipterigena]|uniref:F-box domain-containing protein n=1 Tax=[Torrubiella] hemipterigena TaxID=1531966 RepID=A0A0A1TDL8_9HYPO|nr:hypothetical protein VHEMI04370 [[Torrubiella] hemipterigena]
MMSFNNLPEELVLEIVNCIMSKYERRNQSRQRARALAQLTLVTRQLYRIATPHMYSYLRLSVAEGAHWITKLHDTLSTNPSLRDHVQEVDIIIREYDSEERRHTIRDQLGMVQRIASWFPSAKRIVFMDLYCKFPDEILHIIQNVARNADNLSSFEIDAPRPDFAMNNVLPTMLNFKNLQSLSLLGLFQSFTSPDAFVQNLKPGTGPITSLRIEGWGLSPQMLSGLIQWPRQLQHFRYEGRMSSISPEEVGEMLSVHRTTLETLKMVDISSSIDPEAHMINVSDFPALRGLCLSRWSFNRAGLAFSPAVGHKLVAPQLTDFGWQFGHAARQEDDLKDLQEDEIAWIRGLADFASDHQAKLNRVLVRFRPELWGLEILTPWALLRETSAYLEKRGIELVYDEPMYIIDPTPIQKGSIDKDLNIPWEAVRRSYLTRPFPGSAQRGRILPW